MASEHPHFELLVEEVADAALILDPLGDRFVTANAAACSMLGYTRAELLETPVSSIHPGELPQLEDVVERAIRDGFASTITLTCRTKAGACVPTEIVIWAFEVGAHVHLFALVRDRSEHRAAVDG